MSQLKLTVFGRPAVYDHRGNRIPFGQRARALLSILEIESKSLSRSKIATLLWADRGADQARASLRQCLLEINRACVAARVETPVDASGQIIGLRPEVLTSDLRDLRSALAQHDGQVIADALRTTETGAICDDFSLGTTFDQWIGEFRCRFENDLQDALSEQFRSRKDDLSAQSNQIIRALARARLGHVPGCPIASTALGELDNRHRGQGQITSHRVHLPELALPDDAPPVVLLEELALDGEDGSSLATHLREEIASALARFRDFRVIMVPHGRAAELASSKLQTGFALNLTVRTESARQHVTARLSSLQDQKIIWGNRFLLSSEDIQSAADQIVGQIAGAVAPSLEGHLFTMAGQKPTGAVFAKYLAVKARSQKPESYAAARLLADELEAIIAANPSFAPAYLSLARIYNTDFAWTRAWSSQDADRERALDLARAAISIDRGHVNGYTILGWCHLRRREWGSAKRFFDEALRLNPYHGTRLMEIAFGLLHLGELDNAETLLRRCVSINPVQEDGFHFDLGMLALVRGDPILACEYLTMVIEPDVWGIIAIAIADLQAGRSIDRSRAKARTAVGALWPDGKLPTFSAVHDWIQNRQPFRLNQHRDKFCEGLDVLFS